MATPAFFDVIGQQGQQQGLLAEQPLQVHGVSGLQDLGKQPLHIVRILRLHEQGQRNQLQQVLVPAGEGTVDPVFLRRRLPVGGIGLGGVAGEQEELAGTAVYATPSTWMEKRPCRR